MIYRIALSAAVVSLLAPAQLAAQLITQRFPSVEPAIDRGARVRVSIESAYRQSPFDSRTERLRGTLRAFTAETLYLELPNVMGPLAIPRASIRELEMSLGTSRWPRALKAGSIGALLFGLRMWVAHEDPKSHQFHEDWQAAAVGGVLGFSAGAWYGSRWPAERWRIARLRD
jgi:hypothetical protein